MIPQTASSSGRRRFTSAGAAVALGAASCLALLGTTLAHRPPGANAAPGVCAVTHAKTAAPAAVLLGDTVTVTLHAAPSCAPAAWEQLHLVLVLDGSTSMAGARSDAMREAFVWLVNDLDLDAHPDRLVGVVDAASVARTRCELTNDTGRVVACIRGVGAAGAAQFDLGIQEGLKVLRRGRRGLSDRESVLEVMVVVGDSPNPTGCPPVLQAAGQTKSQGILLITVGLGPDADPTCLSRAATAPRFFVEARDTSAIPAAVRLVRDLLYVGASRLTLSDTVPANMRLVPDSAEPPGLWDEVTRTMTWEFQFPPHKGVTATFQLEPLEVGMHPTNVEARGALIDRDWTLHEWVFAVPQVQVLSPGPVPSPTPGASRTPAPSPTPRPSATPPVASYYLPRVGNDPP